MYGQSAEHLKLSFADRDVDSFGFSEEDIIILSDEIGIADAVVANHENIKQHLERFVEKDDGKTDYVFVYSGHSAQRDEDITAVEELEEEDGQEEFIVPCDALHCVEAFTVVQERLITDKVMRYLGLHALHCHSDLGTPDAEEIPCQAVEKRFTTRMFIEPLYSRASKSNAPGGFNPSAVKKSATVNSAVGKAYYIPWKGKVFCHGFCPRMPLGEKPQVVCVSACKDRQNVLEGGTILPAIMELLRKDPNPTYREVMRAARSGIEPKQNELKEHVNERMKRKKCHWPLNYLLNVHRKCFTDEERNLKEMARLGCDPQLSSRKPLVRPLPFVVRSGEYANVLPRSEH
ncbi:hypothetical protein CVT26_011745 [Gymnopilus dilepis]|uniref:Uncharacterized protein n=1 Tax=Gymnopilus dilepis TaxID=231916 RepID=A0A409W5X2_9AGAR|nr:hypothetical protein CVT26_011745 [Gymnopilus dilepis]